MKNPRLLIIDESVNLILLYKQELEDAGYFVDIANSFKTAIECINKKLYDLIIIETKLKDIKEYNILQAKLNDNRDIPLIINTASNNLKNESTLCSINADDCIAKSSNVSVLEEKVKDILYDFFVKY